MMQEFVVCFVPGVTLVITHLERKLLSPVFKFILLRDTHMDEEGQTLVTVGDGTLPWNENFRLYLCSAVPLFLEGENRQTIG